MHNHFKDILVNLGMLSKVLDTAPDAATAETIYDDYDVVGAKACAMCRQSLTRVRPLTSTGILSRTSRPSSRFRVSGTSLARRTSRSSRPTSGLSRYVLATCMHSQTQPNDSVSMQEVGKKVVAQVGPKLDPTKKIQKEKAPGINSRTPAPYYRITGKSLLWKIFWGAC